MPDPIDQIPTSTPPVPPAPAATPPTPPAPTDPPAGGDGGGDDSEKAVMAAALKKANREAADTRRELNALKAAALPDQERAIATARAEGAAEATTRVGTRLVEAEMRVALAGRNVDPAALLEGVDASKFLDADGEPDTDRIAKWVDRIAPKDQPHDPTAPRVPLGPRTPTTPTRGEPAQVFADFVNGAFNQR